MDAITNSESYALFPLTVFDTLFDRTTFVTGWLLEGAIDADALAAALDRVTQKWRLLSGRLQTVKQESGNKWYLKIPLGTLPPDYATYSLTTSTSSVPLSNYVSIPLPLVSKSLPLSLFLHPSTPRRYTVWESKNHPLTCWNITYFPASVNGGVEYTSIGFARSHGIFDGGGASQIMNALVAELNGREWAVPPLPHAGVNANPIEEALVRGVLAEDSSRTIPDNFAAYTNLTTAGFVKFAAAHAREQYWRGADRRVVLMPKAVLNSLVDEVRSTLRNEKKDIDHVTTGDILVAWIFKTVYSNGTNPNTIAHCTNLASFRGLLASEIPEAHNFPHNAFVPLPYPLLSVADIKSFSISALTNLFAASRALFSMSHVVSAYRMLQNPCFPGPPASNDTMVVSNISASRILESDWSVLGSKRTICGYRYQATPTDIVFTNAVYIAGRLEDGSVVLDVTLNKSRSDLLSGEVQRLQARIARNQNYENRKRT